MARNIILRNLFTLSFSTSSILIVFGLILLLFQFSAYLTLFGLLIFIIGLVQDIVDIGWISMFKSSKNLQTWKEAYSVVARQRTQKLFFVPFFFDIFFIILSIALFFYISGTIL